MEKEATVSPKKLRITIELARNGCTVTACPLKEDKEHEGCYISDYNNEMEYVYPSIEQMAKELPGFISVLKEKSGLNSDNPTKNEEDMGNKKDSESEEADYE